MKVRVIVPFCDKDNTEIEYRVGQVLDFNDEKRCENLIERGLCEVVEESDEQEQGGVHFANAVYALDVVKAALAKIGVSVAPNAKEKGVTTIVEKLNEEMQKALFEELNKEE